MKRFGLWQFSFCRYQGQWLYGKKHGQGVMWYIVCTKTQPLRGFVLVMFSSSFEYCWIPHFLPCVTLLPIPVSMSSEEKHCFAPSLSQKRGEVYEGSWRDGMRCGGGILTSDKEGWTYKGMFLDNVPHGMGEMADSSGRYPCA